MTTSSDVIGEEEAASMSTLLTEIARVMFQEIKRKDAQASRSHAVSSETYLRDSSSAATSSLSG